MNSSGIKRGLAASAISALAVAGLPLFASSASAAAGDVISSATVQKARNGGAVGASIVLKTKNIAAGEIALADQNLGSDLDPNNSNQTITLGAASLVADGAAGDSVKGDGFDEITVSYTATTPAVGDAVKFALYAETGGAGAVNADEARINIDTNTVGAPASVDVSTSQPATVAGFPATFSVSIKDAAGNVTQLTTGESFAVTSAGATLGGNAADASLSPAELASGSTTFTASYAAGGNKTVTVSGAGTVPATVTDSVGITVYDNATITTDEFKFDTGADTWQDGVTAFGGNTQVRVDQNSVTFSFTSADGVDPDTTPDDAGKVVALVLDSASGVIFNGTNPATEPSGNVVVPVLLGADGKGTTTVTLSGVTAGATWTFADAGGSMGLNTVTMNRATATSVVADAGVYVTKIGSPTAVKVSVKDQFGNPIGAPAEVSITRSGRAANAGTTARVAVGADGTATINLPDAGTTAGTETLDVNLFDDQFDGTPTVTAGAATINYTVDGLGADFAVAGATSDPAATVVTPVYDSAAGAGDSVDLNVTGGTPGAPVKVTVDNGALVLKGAETSVDKGSATDTVTLDGAGAAVGAEDIRIVGTKTGIVTVTLESAGRTKTVKFTVAQPAVGVARTATARNVAITAPEKATAGQVATYTVKVTDAFGNAVAGVPVGELAFQVTGPANLQSTDSVTDANGELKVNVILTDNANSAVGVRVTGAVAATQQFGDAVNIVDGVAAPGISASVATATASVTDVVNLEELQDAVDEAQEKVDLAEDVLAAAQDDLTVAKAKKQAANQLVKDAKKDLKAAKKKHKGVKAAKAALRRAQAEYKVASAEVTAANAAVTRATERLAEAQAELEQAEQELEDAQS